MNPQIRAGGPSAIKVLTSHSSFSVIDALAPAYEQACGQAVAIEADSAKTMLTRIRGGEKGDVVILGKAMVEELAQAGIAGAGTTRPFARARVGVAVRAGAPRPDISSVEAFRRSMLAARSIAHTVNGASGMYVPVLMERLGIAAQMKPKTVTRPGGYIARVVAAGEAEIAIQQIVELLAVPGVDLVGPLPDGIQKVFETSAAVFADSKQPAAAESLVRSCWLPPRERHSGTRGWSRHTERPVNGWQPFIAILSPSPFGRGAGGEGIERQAFCERSIGAGET